MILNYKTNCRKIEIDFTNSTFSVLYNALGRFHLGGKYGQVCIYCNELLHARNESYSAAWIRCVKCSYNINFNITGIGIYSITYNSMLVDYINGKINCHIRQGRGTKGRFIGEIETAPDKKMEFSQLLNLLNVYESISKVKDGRLQL